MPSVRTAEAFVYNESGSWQNCSTAGWALDHTTDKADALSTLKLNDEQERNHHELFGGDGCSVSNYDCSCASGARYARSYRYGLKATLPKVTNGVPDLHMHWQSLSDIEDPSMQGIRVNMLECLDGDRNKLS